MATACTTCQRASTNGARIGMIWLTTSFHRTEIRKVPNMIPVALHAVGHGGIASGLRVVLPEVASLPKDSSAILGFVVQ